jgi:FkbM family methyltransferase
MKLIPLWMHLFAYKNWLIGEKELHLLPYLCIKNQNSIDIGANIGIYTYFLRKYSKFCFAFEPNPKLSTQLKSIFSKNIKVFPYAISDKNDDVNLMIPHNQDFQELDGLATIETSNRLKNFSIKILKVKSIRLDDLNMESVGFIKIDVEGHELAVLEGAKDLIARCNPNFLIEIEERHRPDAIGSVNSFLERFGYSGYYLLDGRLTTIKKFNQSTLQNLNSLNPMGTLRIKGKIYINNFIFINTKKNYEILNKFT